MSDIISNQVLEQARRWLHQEVDAEHRIQLASWLTVYDSSLQDDNTFAIDEIQVALRELNERFGASLKFGTAGLRGEMGVGSNRMNPTVIRRTSMGIAKYLLSLNIEIPLIVIGYDTRINSKKYAKITADAFAMLGCEVFLFDTIVPTPLLSYSVPFLKCDVGIMITASHNPPKDNGYKVYWNEGAQIVSPHDREMSQHIAGLPWEPIILPSSKTKVPPEDCVEGYLSAVQNLRVTPSKGAKIVYTPLHGVGGPWLEKVFVDAGHDFVPVAEQNEPDGGFPTVSFPNPEEKGAMDLAKKVAREENADIILANDPDADRLAVALPVQKEDGEIVYEQLTGDQVGLILAHYLLQHGNLDIPRMVATTVVSSSQLRQIAEYHSAEYRETLTGFKYIGEEAIQFEKQGGEFVLGFEEALGYSAGSVAKDKDGLSTALLIADLASDLKSKGKTLWDALNEVRLLFGYTLSTQHSIKRPGLQGVQEIEMMMGNLRDDQPLVIANSKVIRHLDIWNSYEITTTDHGEMRRTLDLPKSNVLIYHLENGDRVVVRPSGTEPKIKFYFEVKLSLPSIESLPTVQLLAQERIIQLKDDMLDQASLD
jgi:phosphomannomutase